MIIIACDPSYAKGYSISIFKNREFVEFNTFYKAECKCINNVNAMIDYILNKYKKLDALFIEDQYISMNPKTYAKLIEARVILETMLYHKFGCEVYRVTPTTWQKMLSSEKIKSAERKRLSKEQAKIFANNDKISEDEADAINIGRWAVDWLSKVTPEYRESCRYY